MTTIEQYQHNHFSNALPPQWRELIKHSDPHSINLPSLSQAVETYSPVLGKIAYVQQSRDCFSSTTPTALATIQSVQERLSLWAEQQRYTLMFPATEASWGLAVQQTVLDLCRADASKYSKPLSCSMDVILIFSAIFPQLTHQYISKITPAQASPSVDPIILNQLNAIKQISSLFTQHPFYEHQPISELHSETRVEDASVHLEETNTLVWLKDIIEKLKNGTWERGVKKEWVDEKIKWRPLKETPPESTSLWFEHKLLPAIMKLSLPEMQTLMDYWPAHHQFQLDDFSNTVKNSHFWGGIKYCKPDATEFLLISVLPQLFNMNTLNFEEKKNVAQHMLSFTKKNMTLFKQRLTLWVNLGGKLLETSVSTPIDTPSHNTGAFENRKIHTDSVYQWIVNSGNKEWIETLVDMTLPPEQPSTIPKLKRSI